jgi:hypothetical protein
MAWSPPADKRRIVWVSAPGDYATFNSNHTPDGTIEMVRPEENKDGTVVLSSNRIGSPF